MNPNPRRAEVPTVRTKRRSNVGVFIALIGGSLLLIAIVIVGVLMALGKNPLRLGL